MGAELVTFIRQSWGNSAPAADSAAVARIRGKIDTEMAKRRTENHLHDLSLNCHSIFYIDRTVPLA